MRMIVLLVVVVIIGWLGMRELQAPVSSADDAAVQQYSEGGDQPPSLPGQPGDVDDFKQDMNDFVDAQNRKQKQRIQQATGGQ